MISGKAVLSFVLGVLSFVTLLSGLPAILLGLAGVREVNQSDGRLAGRGLAIAGMITGALGTIVCVLGLAAILIMHLREAANRVYCENNLKQIGQALHAYHEVHNSFPAGTIASETLPPEKRLSWYVSTLLYLDQEPGRKKPPTGKASPAGRQPGSEVFLSLYEKIDKQRSWDDEFNRPVVNTSIRWFLCPSHPETPTAVQDRPGLTHYVGVAGLGPDAAGLPAQDAKSGMFGYDRRIRRGDVTGGISNTLMAGEASWENGPWSAGGPPTVRGLDPARLPYLGPGQQFGGMHPGGGNLLFVDGGVRFLTDATAPDVWEKLSVIHGNK